MTDQATDRLTEQQTDRLDHTDGRHSSNKTRIKEMRREEERFLFVFLFEVYFLHVVQCVIISYKGGKFHFFAPIGTLFCSLYHFIYLKNAALDLRGKAGKTDICMKYLSMFQYYRYHLNFTIIENNE